MQLNLKVFILFALIGGLFGINAPDEAAASVTVAPLQVIEWTAEEGGEWYQIEIRQSGTTWFDQWMFVEDLCTGTACSFDPSGPMPFGLDAGAYQVFIRWWNPDAQAIRQIQRLDRTSTPDTVINVVNARVQVTIPNDDRFDWVNIWMGTRDEYTPLDHFNRPGSAAGWYERATEMECGATSCTFMADVYPVNDRYVAFLRYYDLESDTLGTWSAQIEFRVNLDRPNAVTNLTLDVDGQNQPTVTWTGRNALIWYRVIVVGGSSVIDQWVIADDLGCAGGGTCTFSPNTTLQSGAVADVYVTGWGPAGYPRGGIDGSGWETGNSVFIPGSNNAFLMQNDLLIFEAESTTLVGEWRRRTSFGNFTGNGYIIWREGNTNTATDNNYTDVMTYVVKIPAAGTYRLMMRATSPDPGDLYNDIWFRVLGEGAFMEAVDPSPEGSGTDYVNMGQDWFKIYNNSTEQWRWQASHVDNDAHEIFIVVEEPGEFAFQISGRSNQFRIDRFAVYDEETYTQNEATALTNPQSPRG